MQTEHEWPLLLSTSKSGKTKFWIIRVLSDVMGRAFLETEYWMDDGAHQKAPKEVQGKNLARTNVTTPLQQAISEAESYFKKQIDRGYSDPANPELTQGRLPLPMLAQDYTKRAHHLHLPAFAQPKLDGCVFRTTILETDQGPKTIEDIVENRLEVSVLSLNENSDTFEYQPVVNWFDNGKLNYKGWVEVVPETGKHVKCTPNHKFLTNCGWVEAQYLDPKVHKIRVRKQGEYLNSLIAGTLLGDTCLSIEKRRHAEGVGYNLIFLHTNEELFRFKIETLGLEGRVSNYTTGYGSPGWRFASTALSNSDFPVKKFYFTGHNEEGALGKRKLLTYETLKDFITEEALSLWIADDGSLRMNNGNPMTPVLSISTHNHNDAQIEQFIEYFSKVWRCIPTAIQDKRVESDEVKSGKFLYFNAKDTLYLLNHLRDKQCRGVEYKYYFPTEDYIAPAQKEFSYQTFTMRQSHGMNPATKYDIEVAKNHNYVANGIVIHNCRCLYQPGVGFWSRLGKVFSNTVDLSHLDLAHCVGPGAILDGELILPPPYTFQQTCEAIKKQRPETALLQYHVFDLVLPEQNFQSRLSGLELLSREFPEPVNLVETIQVSTPEEIEWLQAHYLEAGYEGLILRDGRGLYEIGQRSNGLLKHKQFQDEEFTIVSVADGVGREKGAAIFECRTEQGAHFMCRPRGDYETRRAQFEQADTLIGKRLTVRFQGYTTTEQPVPRFPIGMGVHYDG